MWQTLFQVLGKSSNKQTSLHPAELTVCRGDYKHGNGWGEGCGMCVCTSMSACVL